MQFCFTDTSALMFDWIQVSLTAWKRHSKSTLLSLVIICHHYSTAVINQMTGQTHTYTCITKCDTTYTPSQEQKAESAHQLNKWSLGRKGQLLSHVQSNDIHLQSCAGQLQNKTDQQASLNHFATCLIHLQSDKDRYHDIQALTHFVTDAVTHNL